MNDGISSASHESWPTVALSSFFMLKNVPAQSGECDKGVTDSPSFATSHKHICAEYFSTNDL